MAVNPAYAVIPTSGKRASLRAAVDAVGDQVRVVIIVHNCPPEEVNHWIHSSEVGMTCCVRYPQLEEGETYSLSKAWNIGIAIAENLAAYVPPAEHPQEALARHKIAILNDDAVVPRDWVSTVSAEMDLVGAAAGCSGAPPGQPILYKEAGPVDVMYTMRGWAFMLRASVGLRADESMRYWYADNDLAWRAAAAGGMLMIPDQHVPNLYPNGMVTPELNVQIAKDAARFVEKWGTPPW